MAARRDIVGFGVQFSFYSTFLFKMCQFDTCLVLVVSKVLDQILGFWFEVMKNLILFEDHTSLPFLSATRSVYILQMFWVLQSGVCIHIMQAFAQNIKSSY